MQRHPHLGLALLLLLFAGLFVLLVSWLVYGRPEFSATLMGFQGLDPAHRAAVARLRRDAPRQEPRRVAPLLQARNATAVVTYAGVPLARADLPGFCVPAMSVATVRFVAAGEGLGMPDVLYESMEAQRGRRERVTLAVKVKLDEDRVVPHSVVGCSPVLYWCEAMLDGHPPSGPSRCTAFLTGLK